MKGSFQRGLSIDFHVFYFFSLQVYAIEIVKESIVEKPAEDIHFVQKHIHRMAHYIREIEIFQWNLPPIVLFIRSLLQEAVLGFGKHSEFVIIAVEAIVHTVVLPIMSPFSVYIEPVLISAWRKIQFYIHVSDSHIIYKGLHCLRLFPVIPRPLY